VDGLENGDAFEKHFAAVAASANKAQRQAAQIAKDVTTRLRDT
jgi:hypothetical protein